MPHTTAPLDLRPLGVPAAPAASPSVAPDDLRQRLDSDFAAAGGPINPLGDGAIGVTMFDQAGSQDNEVTVLLGHDRVQQAPAQALVRIASTEGRCYLGVVTAGPFAEPDSLRADSTVLVAVATRGGQYLPAYHGRVRVAILGEQLEDGSLAPPRLRPLPHSRVYRLSDQESAAVLHAEGDLRLGLAVGHQEVVVKVPSTSKAVLPRHTAVLGTTGGGKSNTVAGVVAEARGAGMAVVLLDVEGEYAALHEPNADPRMAAGLRERGLAPAGVPAERMTLYHLVGRDTANPAHPRVRPFSLQFARLSPYAVMEILDLSDAQQERFLKAYDIAKEVLRELGVFPAKGNADQERLALEIDEFERGYPRLTLSLLLDVVGACLARSDRAPGEKASTRAATEALEGWRPHSPLLATDGARQALRKKANAANPPGHVISWRALLGRLGRLNRLRVFYDDASGDRPLNYRDLLRPGNLSVIDLSDTGASELNNIVIADLLHGIQEAQDRLYLEHEQAGSDGATPPRTLVVIEEAHEFLSEERVARLRVLFEQVARIAKRGRKRWLGLVFVTQLPQHLPRQVLGLVNSFVLHKITDPGVLAGLRKSIPGIDEGLWQRLPGLAPGQAVVSFPHMARPLLVSLDPARARLRLVD
jgi:DNA helicase HerA-like ATPase